MEGFAALPRASGTLRVYHGRFVNVTHFSRSNNASYHAIGNMLTVTSRVRAYNVTFEYRNYELMVNDQLIDGSISGCYDYIEFRMVNTWDMRPDCCVALAGGKPYDYKGCHVVVHNLGEYDYLKVELRQLLCRHMMKTVHKVWWPTVSVNWEIATEESRMCQNALFKDIFGAVSIVIDVNATTDLYERS